MVCPRNLHASEKFAIVLLKGIGKTTFESIPPYLDVIHEFILIEDEFQMMRVKWVIGKQRLVVSQISKTLSAMNSYSLEERLYDFNSAINIHSNSSLLEPLYAQNKKTQNYCTLILHELLKLCVESELVREYVWSLESPTYLLGKYVDFFE